MPPLSDQVRRVERKSIVEEPQGQTAVGFEHSAATLSAPEFHPRWSKCNSSASNAGKLEVESGRLGARPSPVWDRLSQAKTTRSRVLRKSGTQQVQCFPRRQKNAPAHPEDAPDKVAENIRIAERLEISSANPLRDLNDLLSLNPGAPAAHQRFNFFE